MLTSKVHTIIRILSLSGLLALFGCAREVVTPARIPQASDSLYTANNRALVRMINELNDTRVAIDTDTSVPDQKLFDLIDGIIRKEKLYTNFREQFKRQYGMTPTEYKNNL